MPEEKKHTSIRETEDKEFLSPTIGSSYKILYYFFSTAGVSMPVCIHWGSFIWEIIRGVRNSRLTMERTGKQEAEKKPFCFEALGKRREAVGKETWASELASSLCGEKGAELSEERADRMRFGPTRASQSFTVVFVFGVMLGKAFDKM